MTGKNTSPHGWLNNPRSERRGETIGGGHFVFRRGDDTNRIRPSQWPFEYGSMREAIDQAEKLAAANPGYLFDVAVVAHSAFVEKPADEATDPAEAA